MGLKQNTLNENNARLKKQNIFSLMISLFLLLVKTFRGSLLETNITIKSDNKFITVIFFLEVSSLYLVIMDIDCSQLVLTCPKLKTETLEQGVGYAHQS